MNSTHTIDQLEKNAVLFQNVFSLVPEEEYLWKQAPDKWCMLEIICHLYDEEREDFHARLQHVLTTPADPLPSIDPPGWVIARNYIAQDYATKLEQFLAERKASIRWLRALKEPKWEQYYEHPKLGPMSGNLFLSNWLAHDYLHFRQITRLKYDYLKKSSGEDLSYAGNW